MGTTSWPLSDDQNEISHSDLKDRKEGEDPVANYTFPPPPQKPPLSLTLSIITKGQL